MDSKVLIVLNEKKSKEPHNSTRGIFCDYSKGFDKPEYYCRCPNCTFIHGGYKTPKEALAKKKCALCQKNEIDKLKKEVRNVDQPTSRKMVNWMLA